MSRDFPGGQVAKDSMLPTQGTRVQIPGQGLDPHAATKAPACHN